MRLKLTEVFAIFGGLQCHNGLISLLMVPRDKRTERIYEGISGDIYSAHINTFAAAKYPCPKERGATVRQEMRRHGKKLSGNNLAIIGPHLRRMEGRHGLNLVGSFELPVLIYPLLWAFFFITMCILLLWFIIASLCRMDIKSCAKNVLIIFNLVCAGPKSFSEYKIFSVS